MEKEEEKQSSQSAYHEEKLSHSAFSFVFEFFITTREEPQERKESELKSSDQSVTFFLPDFFTDDT